MIIYIYILGEGIWHWDGMSDSEDEYWRSSSSSTDDDDDLNNKYKDNDNNKNNNLHYQYFEDLHILVDAANGDENICIEAIQKLSRKHQISKFMNLYDLAKAIQQYTNESLSKSNSDTSSSSTTTLQSLSSPSLSYLEKESLNDLVLLNLLYAPRRSRLHSIMKVLARIENLSHICAWTKVSKVFIVAIRFFI